jgi:hypothetical protein
MSRKKKDLQVSVGWYSPNSKSFQTFPDTKGKYTEKTALHLASLEYRTSSTRVLCPQTLRRSACKGKVVSLHTMMA